MIYNKLLILLGDDRGPFFVQRFDGLAGTVVDADPRQFRMVRVTMNADQTLSFEQCERAAAGSTEAVKCSLLGNQQKYSLEEMNSKRTSLIANGIGVAVLDCAVIVGVVFASRGVGAGIGYLLAKSSAIPFASLMGAQLGGLVGGAFGCVGGIGITLMDKLHPFSRFKRASQIKTLVLDPNGSIVVKDIGAYVSNLDKALRQ